MSLNSILSYRAHFYETYANNTRLLRFKRKTKSFKITIYTVASKVSSHTFHDSYHIIILKQVYSIYNTTPNPVEEHGQDQSSGRTFSVTQKIHPWKMSGWNPKVMEVDGSNDFLFTIWVSCLGSSRYFSGVYQVELGYGYPPFPGCNRDPRIGLALGAATQEHITCLRTVHHLSIRRYFYIS